ncbi:MAG: Eco57I restriction-modification methylase domain-containing protein, partial [Pirellulaceae bacterium]
MPLETGAERRWAYYVPQPIPDDAVEHAPETVRDLKILDPAVGSGHFLVVAFDLLIAMYKEEARHRGESPFAPRKYASTLDTGQDDAEHVSRSDPDDETLLSRSDPDDETLLSRSDPDDETLLSRSERRLWSDIAIVERILEHNLHGIDLDPRAMQIAAAALWLKAQQVCPEAKPKQLNLVASNLGIASLPDNDPALVELRQAVQDETGIPAKLTNQIIDALRGADHLGSLLKVDAAIASAISAYEEEVGWKDKVRQIDLFPDGSMESRPRQISRDWAETGVLSALETFLSRHTSAQELGLRLHGEQLAASVRFVRMLREDTYDLVVANPPYQGTSKMSQTKYVQSEYKRAKADLFAAFLLRGLQLVRANGLSAMLTMRNWMFIKQYSGLRQHLLEEFDLRALGDLAIGAFDEVPNDVLSVAVSVFIRADAGTVPAIALQPTPPDDVSYDRQRTSRKRAATLCQVGRHQFEPAALKVVPEWPLVYWWNEALLSAYTGAPCIGEVAPARKGMSTGDNTRFLRKPWEVLHAASTWLPLVKGGEGREWLEPCSENVRWQLAGLEVRNSSRAVIRNPQFYLKRGVAFSMIAVRFSARAHRVPSIFEGKGSSVFPQDLASSTCAMNSTRARDILQSLNPGIGFEVGDVNRLPLFPIANADQIFAQIEDAFTVHESHREPSIEFNQPGPSPWRAAQEWAQRAVDRSDNEPLPEYVEELDPEAGTDHISFAVGVALGRFGSDGEGVQSRLSLRESSAQLDAASSSQHVGYEDGG